jgi:hypothetical protein
VKTLGRYPIVDDRRPGGLERYCVDPYWVMLALLLGGAWLGWPWFVLNAFALGATSKWREIGLVGASIALSFLLVGVLLYARSARWISSQVFQYLVVVVPALKLGLGFLAFRSQEVSHAAYRYFGGDDQQGGVFVLLVLAIAARIAVHGPANELLRWVLQ